MGQPDYRLPRVGDSSTRLDPDDVAKARLAVAGRARDNDDARTLLNMLGIGPEQEAQR